MKVKHAFSFQQLNQIQIKYEKYSKKKISRN